jgi:excisionase family DNA binding protein
MTTEVTIANPEHWVSRVSELANALRRLEPGAEIISDPTGEGPNPERPFVLVDPTYWASQPGELLWALIDDQRGHVTTEGSPSEDRRPVRAVPATGPRLTLTVEEAASALGISRASAYEAVRVGEIPSVRIGRRILVPQSALQRMLDAAGEFDQKAGR